MSDIDLNGALSSPSLGFKYYVNYYYQGNTCGITVSEIGQIQSTWSDKLPAWKHYVEDKIENGTDGTLYEIDESDYDEAMKNGEQYGKDLTGFNNDSGDKAHQAVDVGVTGALALGTGGLAVINGLKYLKNGCKAMTGTPWGLMISCTLDLALALLVKYVLHPNKEQHEALVDVQAEMGNQRSILDGTVYEIEDMDAELQALNDEANTLVEESNQQMAEDKSNYDYSNDTIEYFQADVTRGYRLTENDVAAYQAALQYMRESGAAITETQNGTQTRMNEIFDDMTSYEEGFNDAAETMGEVEGFTNYAAGFDETTKAACNWESINLYVAGGAATLDAGLCLPYVAVWATCWMAIFMAMAAMAALWNFQGAKEQGEWAKQAEAEIGERTTTQDMHESSMGTYDEYLDYYDGYMMDTSGLVLEVPDDTAPPTDNSIPTPTGGGSGNGGDGDGGKKKKEE